VALVCNFCKKNFFGGRFPEKIRAVGTFLMVFGLDFPFFYILSGGFS
jgi:hypothetical protein